MQRTIFGDDALTLDNIEPMIPAELAVMIDTFAPLAVAKSALSAEDPGYGESWLEDSE